MRHFVNFGASTSTAPTSGKPATSILREQLLRVAPIVVHSNIQVSPPVINLVTPAHDVEMNMGEIIQEISDIIPFTEEPMELDLDDLLIMIDEQEAAAAAPTPASIAAPTPASIPAPDPGPQEQEQLEALTDKDSLEEETHAFIELPGQEWDEAGIELEAQEAIGNNEWNAAGKSLEASVEVSIPGPSRRTVESESPIAGPSRRATDWESPIAGPSNESPAAQGDIEGNDEDEEELTNLIQQINLDILRQEEVIAGEEEILQQQLKKIEEQNEKLQKIKNGRLEVQRLLIEHKRLKALARKNKNKIRGVRDKMPKM